MSPNSHIAALIAPGDSIIWSGRAHVLRSIGLGQIFFALVGTGLICYGVSVLWNYYGLRGTVADSVFRDALGIPKRVHFIAGVAIVVGLIAVAGFVGAILQARGKQFYLTQSQAFVQISTLFGETSISGRIQAHGQVATARHLFGSAVIIPTGAGSDQDGFIAFDDLRDAEVTEVVTHLGRLQLQPDSRLDAS
ncbi:MAG: hypothetical protein ACRCS3_06170 [Paracoccaceae bacterium]